MAAEIINYLSVLALMSYLLAVASVMPHKGMWGKRLLIWALAVLVGSRALTPWLADAELTAWSDALNNAVFVGMIWAWKADMWAFVRRKFMNEQRQQTYMRRIEDWRADRQLAAEALRRAHGGRGQS